MKAIAQLTAIILALGGSCAWPPELVTRLSSVLEIL
jgi:hypothetical protein